MPAHLVFSPRILPPSDFEVCFPSLVYPAASIILLWQSEKYRTIRLGWLNCWSGWMRPSSVALEPHAPPLSRCATMFVSELSARHPACCSLLGGGGGTGPRRGGGFVVQWPAIRLPVLAFLSRCRWRALITLAFGDIAFEGHFEVVCTAAGTGWYTRTRNRYAFHHCEISPRRLICIFPCQGV